jgi:hypothetical protein
MDTFGHAYLDSHHYGLVAACVLAVFVGWSLDRLTSAK